MDKSVLVTGSSRGIGRAIAEAIAPEYEVILHCRSQRAEADALRESIAASGGSARVLQFDIADREQCTEALLKDMEQHGAYYGVVCNAGVAHDNAFPVMTGEQWDRVVHTNLDGLYNVLNPVVMPMVRRRKPGRIITLSSVSGIIGNRGQANYSAAKAGIIAASKTLAVELAKRAITVNCVAPGMIETDMIADAPIEEAMKLIPARRLGQPDEVASLVKYLLSEQAGYITRQVISVNGGLC
ncbi:MAG: 3-oxoacyl-ACP reductase FabG [Pseudomonadales bacterium]